MHPNDVDSSKKRPVRNRVALAVLFWLSFVACSTTHADDWPAYRRDAKRSAVTSETIRFPLHRQWSYRTAQSPQPAWPEPGRAYNALDFDNAFVPVVASGIVYFGSSGDDAVRAVDATTGELKWSFVTGAPIRFAPHIDAGKLYVASDDGCVYCLDAANGKELWWFRGGLDERNFIAQGRLASRWPARSGVLVREGVVYVTMGMWPSEGVFLYALDANTGRQVWCNDTDYADYIEYPHPPSVAFGGPAPQGYLLAHQGVLVVPTGRSSPAGYDMRSGKQHYYNAGAANRGGAYVVIGGNHLFASAVAWQPDQIVRLGQSPSHPADSLAALDIASGTEQWAYTKSIKSVTDPVQGPRWRSAIAAGIYGRQHAIFSGRRLFAMGNGKVDAFTLQDDHAKPLWSVDQPRVYCEALAANALLLGQDGAIVALNPESGEQIWRQAIEGQVRGLAVSDGRIVTSNERGEIVCFANQLNREPIVFDETSNHLDNGENVIATDLLKQVPSLSTLKGYALVVGEPNADLALALAKNTQLHVVSILDHRAKAFAHRKRLLSTTPFYGKRISVLTIDKARAELRLPLVPHFANLVVVSGNAAHLPGSELYRVLRPCGGVMAFVNGASQTRSLHGVDLPKDELQDNLVVRGKLAGAFDWDSNNKADHRVRWPLEFQWFGDPGPQLVTPRHARPPTPITANGRMFVFGESHVSAVDAYNGTQLWQRRVGPASVGEHADPVADDQYLYLRQGGMVARFDANNGNLSALYQHRGGPAVQNAIKPLKIDSQTRNERSGSIEIDGSGKQLSITLTTRSPLPSVDDAWELAFDFRKPQQRLQVAGPGKFELIVQPWNAAFRKLPTLKHPQATLQRISDDGKVSVVTLTMPWSEIERFVGWRPTNFAMSADIKLWRKNFALGLWAKPLVKDTYFFNNAEAIIVVAAEAQQIEVDSNVLSPLLPVPLRDDLPFHARSKKQLPLMVLRDGNKDMRDETGNPWHSTPRAAGFELWQRESPFTLKTGWRDYTRSYGCSGFSCSASTDFFRSGTIGVYDREDDSGVRNISGIRSGCGLTLLPAQGMLLYSESASDCTCGYSFATSFAMAPTGYRRNEDWALFHQQQLTPGQIRQSALNLGGPGDRRDDKSLLWLGYPRPKLAVEGGYTMDLPYRVESFPGFGATRVNSDRVPFKQTEHPWLYASQLKGLSELSMDLIYYQPQEALVSLENNDSPTIDGRLDDQCWNGFGGVASPVSAGKYFFRHDAKHLYIGYEEKSVRDRRGKTTPWKAAVTERDGRVGRDNHVRLALRNSGDHKVATFGVSASGAAYDSMLDFTTRLPALKNMKVDGKQDDWHTDPEQRGSQIKLSGSAQIQLGWNETGLLLLLHAPKGMAVGDDKAMGGVSLLLARDGVSTMQQLTIDLIDDKLRINSWHGEEKRKAAITAIANDDNTTIEAVVPWESLEMKADPGATLSMAIRYYDPTEPFFEGERSVPFTSASDRIRQFRPNNGIPLRLSQQAEGEVVATLQRRNHYGYLAYDLHKLGTDQTTWNGTWTAKVKTNEDTFQAELAIPWSTLDAAGIARQGLHIDLHKPLFFSEALDRALPLFERQSIMVHATEQPPVSNYRVRLHFAELDDVTEGERVFSVMLQGKIVLKDLDVIKEAGGRYHALVKEFPDIRADRRLELKLIPENGTLDTTAVPILNGLELQQQ